jgi:protein-S-isoprenylcysteine O-methyltransferase Ste14
VTRSPGLPEPPGAHADSPRTSQQRKQQRRQRITQALGLLLLLSGYAALAVSPDTPSEWVLLRVVLGFALLLCGFGLAILPWLSRISSGEE